MNIEFILNYLYQLEQNNYREWFHANKQQYLTAKEEFESLIQELTLQLHKADNHIMLLPPKELTFKIQRDTRFSHDKSPYNPSFRAHISSKAKLPIPVGYFLKLQPNDRSFLGGGLFTDAFKEAIVMVRNKINLHGDRWEEIISSPDFQNYFTIKGTALKRVPQGYDQNHSQIEYIKHKSWYIEYPISDKQLMDKNFVEFATKIFIKMKPFHSFLNDALKDFQMPTR